MYCLWSQLDGVCLRCGRIALAAGDFAAAEEVTNDDKSVDSS